MKQPDETQLPPKDVLSPKDFLEIVWKGAAGLSAACYLIGFIVVNIHLSRFGYYSVSLLNAHYLTAGIWALLPVAIGWFFSFLAFQDTSLSDISKKKLFVMWILCGLGFLGSFVLLVFFSEWVTTLEIGSKWIVLSVAGFFFSLLAVASASAASLLRESSVSTGAFEKLENLPPEIKIPDSLKNKIGYYADGKMLVFKGVMSSEERDELLRQSADESFKKAVEGLFGRSRRLRVTFGTIGVIAFMAGLVTLLYLGNFSHSLYGEIPGTLGGGKPRLVRLVVKSEVREDLIAMGIRFSEGIRMSESVKLLVGTEKEYIVLIGKGDSSVSIRSDMVEAILYEGRR